MNLYPTVLFLLAISAVTAKLEFPDGVWTFRGYGYVIRAQNNGSSLTFYEESAISCIQNDDLISFLSNVETEGDVATIKIDPPIQPYVADRTDDFLGACADGITPSRKGDSNYVRNVLFDFDILDTVFQEHYAFFGLRNIDWEQLTGEARSTLESSSSPTDQELETALISVLAPLDDGHVNLVTDTAFFRSKELSIFGQMEEEFGMQDEISDLDNYTNAQFMEWTAIIESYVEFGGLKGEPLKLVWGKIDHVDGHEIGYMQLWDFEPEDDVQFLAQLDNIFSDFAGVETMIIDIRINNGGNDAVGLELASRFTTERVLAYTKQTRYGSGFTKEFQAYIEPCTAAHCYLNGDVIVIVSGSTVSTGETFSVAMRQLPRVRLLGENTLGAFSDILLRSLPNGWLFSLSNQVYRDPNGVVYESVGLPPDIGPESGLLELSEREAGIDTWLELALTTATASDTTNSGAPSTIVWANLLLSVALILLLAFW